MQPQASVAGGPLYFRCYECPNCHSKMFCYTGIQWWPDRVVQPEWQPVLHSPDHPQHGGLRTFTCAQCHSTFVEPSLRALPCRCYPKGSERALAPCDFDR